MSMCSVSKKLQPYTVPRAFHCVALPRFPGGPAVHTWPRGQILTLVKYGSPYQSHTTKVHLCGFSVLFLFPQMKSAFLGFAVVLKRTGIGTADSMTELHWKSWHEKRRVRHWHIFTTKINNISKIQSNKQNGHQKLQKNVYISNFRRYGSVDGVHKQPIRWWETKKYHNKMAFTLWHFYSLWSLMGNIFLVPFSTASYPTLPSFLLSLWSSVLVISHFDLRGVTSIRW